jgi:hypothetical protein
MVNGDGEAVGLRWPFSAVCGTEFPERNLTLPLPKCGLSSGLPVDSDTYRMVMKSHD